MTRTEFGVERSVCACGNCQINCRFMPGMLIPADLPRLIPAGVDPFAWADANLLASPGALVTRNGEVFRVPTLVPAVKADGSCIHLGEGGRCGVHQDAPFGCAFFSCGPEIPGMSARGITAIYRDPPEGLYKRLWARLSYAGKAQERAEVLRGRMRRYMGLE